MSLSSFHQHFKAMTAMSPLQYQMQLRLQEARRLMLSGHDSPFQFSREYSRTFGAPLMRDMSRLRANPDMPMAI